MSLDNFEVIGTIGEGAFGKVTQVKRKSDGEMLVWKELNYGKMSEVRCCSVAPVRDQ